MKRILGITAMVIALTACGGGGSDGDSSKGLFSIWNKTTDNAPLDLRGGSLGTSFEMGFFFAGGAQCNCDNTFIGTETSGSFVLNSCSYKYGSGSEDPGCNAINQTGSYSKTSSTLNFSGESGSSSYR